MVPRPISPAVPTRLDSILSTHGVGAAGPNEAGASRIAVSLLMAGIWYLRFDWSWSGRFPAVVLASRVSLFVKRPTKYERLLCREH